MPVRMRTPRHGPDPWSWGRHALDIKAAHRAGLSSREFSTMPSAAARADPRLDLHESPTRTNIDFPFAKRKTL